MTQREAKGGDNTMTKQYPTISGQLEGYEPGVGPWNATPRNTTYTPQPRIYRIIRFRQGSKPRTIRSNVTLTEAQLHCRREDTHGYDSGGVRWFDGYDYMRGCSPKGK